MGESGLRAGWLRLPDDNDDVHADHAHDRIVESVREFFLPFVRTDPPRWTWRKRALAGIVAVTLLPLRAAVLALALALCALCVWLAGLGLPESELGTTRSPWRRALLVAVPACSRLALHALSVHRLHHHPLSRDEVARRLSAVASHPHTPAAQAQEARFALALVDRLAARAVPLGSLTHSPFPVVANHLGYLDILVLTAVHLSFLSKADIARVPVIGAAARACGCVFVRGADNTTDRIVQRLREHHARPHATHNTCVFPEGTTTNGHGMLVFRSGAFAAQLPVHPVFLSFPHAHFNPTWESIRFHHHLLFSMLQVANHAHVTVLPAYTPSEAERQDARLYARNVGRLVAAVCGGRRVFALNRQHKTVFHRFLMGQVGGEEALAEGERLLRDDATLCAFRDAVLAGPVPVPSPTPPPAAAAK